MVRGVPEGQSVALRVSRLIHQLVIGVKMLLSHEMG